MLQLRTRAAIAALLVAACTSGGGSSSTTPTPTPAAVASVAVSLASSSIQAGSGTSASATLRDANGNPLTGRTINWSSSSTSVATVSSGGTITALSAGTTSIIATSEGQSGSMQLTVTPPPPAPVASVAVSLSASNVTAGTGSQGTATLRDAGGNVLSNRTITWASSNPGIGSITQGGTITTIAAGTTSIIATSEGQSGSAPLTVTAPIAPVTAVTLTGNSRVKVGDSYSYTVTARLGDGTVVQRPITWGITVAGTATITQSGVMTPLTAGTVGIVVTIDGVQWFTTYTAYDWIALSTSTLSGVTLASDVSVTNQYGTTADPSLLVSCGTNGVFAIGVGFSNIVTGNGLVTYAGDNGTLISQNWLEYGPNYNTLTYSGSTNALQKSFATTLATNHLFTFAFNEFLSGSHATSWRLTGMNAAIAPLLAACPANSLRANDSAVAAALTALGTGAPTGPMAAGAVTRAATGPAAGPSPVLAPAVRGSETVPMHRGGR